jgi:hypothetical protein
MCRYFDVIENLIFYSEIWGEFWDLNKAGDDNEEENWTVEGTRGVPASPPSSSPAPIISILRWDDRACRRARVKGEGESASQIKARVHLKLKPKPLPLQGPTIVHARSTVYSGLLAPVDCRVGPT